MSKVVLSLDLATVTGWAVLKDGKVESGSEKFTHKATQPGRRFAKFAAWLNSMASKYPDIRRIVVEKAFSAPNDHGGTGEVRGGFLAFLYVFADARGITVEQFHSGTVKKAFTGSGRATKPDMMARARELGFHPKDDNESDAIAVLCLATGRVPNPVEQFKAKPLAQMTDKDYPF